MYWDTEIFKDLMKFVDSTRKTRSDAQCEIFRIAGTERRPTVVDESSLEFLSSSTEGAACTVLKSDSV